MAEKSRDWDFFLAHAGADNDTADALYDYLVGNCRVFLDSRCLRLGDDWDTELAEAQRRSLVTVVLVSGHTTAAYYQREEVAAAIALAREDRNSHRVVPIYTGTTSEDMRIPYGLRLKHGITLGDGCSLADAAAKLLDLRRSITDRGSNLQSDASARAAVKRPSRPRERITLLRWLGRIPDDFDAYFLALWQAGLGKERIAPEDVDRLERNVGTLIRDYRRIIEKLPDIFEQTGPSDRERQFFTEVFPSFQRRCAACFEASRTLISGLNAPTTDGKSVRVPFSMLYDVLEVQEHLKVLRLAAEEIIIQFPVDEVDEARREPTTPS